MGSQQLLLSRKVIRMSGYDFRDACESGDLDKVKGLIKDVDINETDEYGFTGLHLASEHGHLKIVEELMAAGCKIDELIYAGACCGCIHLAIMKENMELLKLLLAKKCEVNLIDDINGNSPLYLATTLDQVETVKILIAAGADVNLADWDEKTPLHFAASNGFGEVAKLLIEAKASIDAVDANGKTPYDMADAVKENEMMDFLKACATGKIPAKAPAAKVREARVMKEVIPLQGCGEGCANPNDD